VNRIPISQQQIPRAHSKPVGSLVEHFQDADGGFDGVVEAL